MDLREQIYRARRALLTGYNVTPEEICVGYESYSVIRREFGPHEVHYDEYSKTESIMGLKIRIHHDKPYKMEVWGGRFCYSIPTYQEPVPCEKKPDKRLLLCGV